MKKAIAILTAFCVLFSLCGCTGMGDDEREYLSRHYDNSTVQDHRIFKATDYTSLINDLYQIFDDGLETCTIRFMGYDGNAESDYHKALGEVINSAIGKYAVYEVGGAIEKIVTFYEVNLSASYKISTKSLADMVFISNSEEKKLLADSIVRGTYDSVTVFFRPEYEDSTELRESLREAYIRHPASSIFVPTAELQKVYSVDDVPGSVMLYTVKNKLTEEENQEKLLELKTGITELVNASTGSSAAEKLCSTVVLMSSDASLSGNNQEDMQAEENTAYGGIINKNATSFGYALALKAVCEGAGISCTLVEGEKNGAKYFWNIVSVNGGCYHVDVTENILSGETVVTLRSDEDNMEKYSWDTASYPLCGAESFSIEAVK